MNINRRQAILKLIKLVPIGLVAAGTLVGCGGNDGLYGGGNSEPNTPPPESNGACGDGAGISYANPGHAHTVLSLSAAEMDAAVEGPYVLLGGGHQHSVTLTTADFLDLENGQTVQKLDLEGHNHVIEIVC